MKLLSDAGPKAARDGSGVAVLDGFRGLAILMVLVYHTWLFSWFTPELAIGGVAVPVDAFARTGYLGVEFFFAISGFVLFLPYARRPAGAAAPESIGRFARKRALKIVPSYLIALAATFVSLASLRVPVALPTALAEHLLAVANFFSSDVGRANSVFWSLSIEVQFYLVFPALALAFRRRPVLVASVMVAAALAYRYGVAGCCLLSEPVNRQLPAFADVYAAGMLAAYGVARTRERPDVRGLAFPCTVGALAATAALVAAMLGANAVTYDPGGRERWILANRTFVAAALGALFFCSCFAVGAWRAAVANPLARALAAISYNLYLWHALVMIWLWKSGVLHAATRDPHADPAWKVAFIALGWSASLAIATALTYVVERPILSAVRPQRFAFPWPRLIARIAPSETLGRRT